MKTYSLDFRERALAVLDRGRPLPEVAELLGVGSATLKRWRRQRRTAGSLAPKPKPGRPPKIAPPQYAALIVQVQAQPDATLAEHCARWAADQDVTVSVTTMSRLLHKVGWPLKKSP